MRKAICLFLVLIFASSHLFSENEAFNSELLYRESEDLNDFYNSPFEYELDFYEKRMNGGRTAVFAGVFSTAFFAIAGTVFSTLGGMERIPQETADALVYSSYAGVSLSITTSLIGFIIWDKGSKNYMKTLELKTQYYNLITQ